MQGRVLFVDDEATIRQSFAEILRREGFAVDACESAQEACAVLQAGAYDLIITDMRMETPTAGFDVIRAAQVLPNPPPVALLTAFPIPAEDLREYRLAAVISKGSGIGSLINKVHELIREVA